MSTRKRRKLNSGSSSSPSKREESTSSAASAEQSCSVDVDSENEESSAKARSSGAPILTADPSLDDLKRLSSTSCHAFAAFHADTNCRGLRNVLKLLSATATHTPFGELPCVFDSRAPRTGACHASTECVCLHCVFWSCAEHGRAHHAQHAGHCLWLDLPSLSVRCHACGEGEHASPWTEQALGEFVRGHFAALASVVSLDSGVLARFDAVLDNGTLGVRGVANLGNTCFIAVLLQCLSNASAVRSHFVRGSHERRHVRLALDCNADLAEMIRLRKREMKKQRARRDETLLLHSLHTAARAELAGRAGGEAALTRRVFDEATCRGSTTVAGCMGCSVAEVVRELYSGISQHPLDLSRFVWQLWLASADLAHYRLQQDCHELGLRLLALLCHCAHRAPSPAAASLSFSSSLSLAPWSSAPFDARVSLQMCERLLQRVEADCQAYGVDKWRSAVWRTLRERRAWIVQDEDGCPTHAAFEGQFESAIACARCQYESATRESLLDISLHLDGGAKDELLTLPACLRQFVAAEQLSGYKCPQCGAVDSTARRLRLARAPPCLMVHLKRFGEDGALKTGGAVRIDDSLDLAPFTTDSAAHHRYHLRSLITHAGTLSTGHYKCYLKKGVGEAAVWFGFDDDCVGVVRDITVDYRDKESRLLQKEAYMLFYERVE